MRIVAYHALVASFLLGHLVYWLCSLHSSLCAATTASFTVNSKTVSLHIVDMHECMLLGYIYYILIAILNTAESKKIDWSLDYTTDREYCSEIRKTR